MRQLQAARGASLTVSESRRNVWTVVGIALVVVVADQATKTWVVHAMADRDPIRLLGGLVTITYALNPGAAFSFGTGMTVVFTLLATTVVVAVLRTASRLRSRAWALALGLLLGGALGNLVDRLLRPPAPGRGYVVDWIELPHWPVFNLADSALVTASCLMVLLALRGVHLDGTRAS